MQFTRPNRQPYHRKSRRTTRNEDLLWQSQQQQHEQEQARIRQAQLRRQQEEARTRQEKLLRLQQEQAELRTRQQQENKEIVEKIQTRDTNTRLDSTPSLSDILQSYKEYISRNSLDNSAWITPQIENTESRLFSRYETLWRKERDSYTIDDSIFEESFRKKEFLESEGASIGVVITTHGDNGVFARQTVESFVRELPSNTFIVLFINESEDPITLGIGEKYPQIKVIHVEDQKAGGGLTGTWNRGIEECMAASCDVVVLANDDILFDSSVTHILHSAYMDASAPGSVYCPVSNAPGPGGSRVGALCPFNRKQLSPGPRCEPDYELVVTEKGKTSLGNCNGFFMVFPIQTLLSNVFARGHYFDPNFPFGGNEVEWCKRFISRGGKVTVVPKSFIYHYKNMAWRHDDSNANQICLYTINTGGYEGDEILISTFKNLPFEKLYFTDNIRLIYTCVKEDVAPFYVSTREQEAKLIQRTVKTSPHLYLPSSYERSIYIDGNVHLCDAGSCAEDLILSLLKINKDLICFAHPTRSRAIDECMEVIKLKLETEENVNSIKELWQKMGFPDTIGLAETNVLVRYHKRIIRFSEDWTRHIGICRRDQISFDYLRWKHKVDSMMLTFERKKTMFDKKKHANPVRRTVVEK